MQLEQKKELHMKMTEKEFGEKLNKLQEKHNQYIKQENSFDDRLENGIYQRYVNPVVTDQHVPLEWRYDLNYESNPYLMERMGINATLNSAAIEFNGKIYLVVRIEGWDRKSFFAIAESETGVDGFKFGKFPLELPDLYEEETNVYDMRLTKHEDGWIYGVFCSESHDSEHPHDLSAAVAQCGIIRTKDMKNWERLPNLKTSALQQRNCVLHPEFVDGKYAFYTRPLAAFMDLGAGEGLCWGLCDDITNAVIDQEVLIDGRTYHTIKEGKNGQGPTPIKTKDGWVHLAHGVRGTAAGMRYVLYLFVTSLEDPTKIIYAPGGYFMAARGQERVGDVSNVLFSNGWVARENGEVFIYYGSSDTRMHVATTTVEQLLDYAKNTPQDGIRSSECVKQRIALIKNNF